MVGMSLCMYVCLLQLDEYEENMYFHLKGNI